LSGSLMTHIYCTSLFWNFRRPPCPVNLPQCLGRGVTHSRGCVNTQATIRLSFLSLVSTNACTLSTPCLGRSCTSVWMEDGGLSGSLMTTDPITQPGRRSQERKFSKQQPAVLKISVFPATSYTPTRCPMRCLFGRQPRSSKVFNIFRIAGAKGHWRTRTYANPATCNCNCQSVCGTFAAMGAFGWSTVASTGRWFTFAATDAAAAAAADTAAADADTAAAADAGGAAR
jgi:hypothetical protein